MNTRELIEAESEFDYEVVEIDQDALAMCNKAFDNYGVNPKCYKFAFNERPPWRAGEPPQKIIRGMWYARHQGRKGCTLSVQRGSNDEWEYRLELEVPYGDAWNAHEVVTGDHLESVLSSIFDGKWEPRCLEPKKAVWESIEFDYDEPGIDEATRSRLAKEFPHLWFQLEEHTKKDQEDGGWPNIRIWNTFRGQPHDSINCCIGWYVHGQDGERYDEPQLWFRGQMETDETGWEPVPNARITTTEDLINHIRMVDRKYFIKAHEYAGTH